MSAVSSRRSTPLWHALVAAAVAAAMLLAQACSEPEARSASSEASRERPEAVPADARFVGGADGGVYVVVERADGSSEAGYQGKIYHSNGELWYEGQLVLVPADADPVDLGSQGIFTGWDGDTLYLNDQRYLRAPHAP